MLKEEDVLSKCKANSIEEVKNLNLWGLDLENIDIISKMKNLEIVSLSLNQINSLKPFENLKNLKELFLRKNNIKDINEIKYLKNCPNLKLLWIEENPFCESNPNYREEIIKELPQIVKLDNKKISSKIEHEEQQIIDINKINEKIENEKQNEKNSIEEGNNINININSIEEYNNINNININSIDEENIKETKEEKKEDRKENKKDENNKENEEKRIEENYNINDINSLLEESENQNQIIDINSQDQIPDNTLINNILKEVDTTQTILMKNNKNNDTTINNITEKTGIQKDKIVDNILKDIDTSSLMGNDKSLFNCNLEAIKNINDIKEIFNESINLDIMRSNSLIQNPTNYIGVNKNHPIRYPSQKHEFGEYYYNYLNQKQNYHYKKEEPINPKMNTNSINAVLQLLNCLEPIELFYVRNLVVRLLNEK